MNDVDVYDINRKECSMVPKNDTMTMTCDQEQVAI